LRQRGKSALYQRQGGYLAILYALRHPIFTAKI
jgi:hypothetical protein